MQTSDVQTALVHVFGFKACFYVIPNLKECKKKGGVNI